MSRRLSKALSLFLGVLMFMFGFLKFFQPIRGWFDIQIQESHLPHEAILAGKLGEMVTGCLFLLPWLRRIVDRKNQRTTPPDRVFDARCSDGHGNLCPPTASGAC